MRYLHLDLKVTSQINRLYAESVIPKKILQILFIQNSDETFLLKGRSAIAMFMMNIRKLSETSKIILLDGDREAIYKGVSKQKVSSPINILFNSFQSVKQNIYRAAYFLF